MNAWKQTSKVHAPSIFTILFAVVTERLMIMNVWLSSGEFLTTHQANVPEHAIILLNHLRAFLFFER